MAPGTSTPRPTSSAPAGPHSAATTLHPRTRRQPQPSPPFPPGPGAGLGEVGSEASALSPPLSTHPNRGLELSTLPASPPHALTAAAPPLPDGAGATPHRREPSAGRASPALPFIPAPAGARALYPEAPHYRTGSQLVPFRDLGWVILAGPVVRAPSPSQTGRREPDLGTSRLQADSRVPGEPRHLPALSARSRGSLLPHVHSPRVPRGSAGRWGHSGGLGDNPAFQQPPRPARIPAMPLPRTRLPRAPGALRGHRGTDPAQPLSTPPLGSFKRGSCPRHRLCGRGPLGCRDGLGVLDLAQRGGGVDLDPSTMGLKANSQLSQHPGAPPACTDTSN